MIYIKRDINVIPKVLSDSELYNNVKERKISKITIAIRFPYSIPHFMDELCKTFFNKCAYCEKKLTKITPANLDFFRPLKKAEHNNGKVDEEHYWWLGFEWFNLYLACIPCTEKKKRKFPIKQENRSPIESNFEQLKEEEALLLDPCIDEPSNYLIFKNDGKVVAYSESERGNTTIEVLKLNREELVLSRKSHLDNVTDFFHEKWYHTFQDDKKMEVLHK
ncbi:MAG: hypothetical protein GY793_00760 [Proteobacteria bacterium]|nr:hypothetical protein [Pseudomonadota bacterium]